MNFASCYRVLFISHVHFELVGVVGVCEGEVFCLSTRGKKRQMWENNQWLARIVAFLQSRLFWFFFKMEAIRCFTSAWIKCELGRTGHGPRVEFSWLLPWDFLFFLQFFCLDFRFRCRLSQAGRRLEKFFLENFQFKIHRSATFLRKNQE